jgi:hypothetical protein
MAWVNEGLGLQPSAGFRDNGDLYSLRQTLTLISFVV